MDEAGLDIFSVTADGGHHGHLQTLLPVRLDIGQLAANTRLHPGVHARDDEVQHLERVSFSVQGELAFARQVVQFENLIMDRSRVQHFDSVLISATWQDFTEEILQGIHQWFYLRRALLPQLAELVEFAAI